MSNRDFHVDGRKRCCHDADDDVQTIVELVVREYYSPVFDGPRPTTGDKYLRVVFHDGSALRKR